MDPLDLIDAIEVIDPKLADTLRAEATAIYDPGTDTYDADCLPALLAKLKAEADRVGVEFDDDGKPIDADEEREEENYGHQANKATLLYWVNECTASA